MTRRTERIGELLRGEIAKALREEVTDPRVQLVTLTQVDVAPDLSHAIIYWSSMASGARDRSEQGAEQRQAEILEIGSGLESAAGFLRSLVARKLPNLRRTPALRFSHDESLETGSRTLAVLRTLHDDKKT